MKSYELPSPLTNEACNKQNTDYLNAKAIKLNNDKKTLPSYFLLIVLPCFFCLFVYLFVLNVDKKQYIEDIKLNLTKKATDFMSKTTAVDYYTPHFQKLYDKIFEIIHKNPNKKAITNEIDILSKKLDENLRCAIFDNRAQLINPYNLQKPEINFFTYAWNRIHDLKAARYDDIWGDQALVVGREFNANILKEHDEYCIPIFSMGKNGVFYFKNYGKNLAGIIIYINYKKDKNKFIEMKVNDLSTKDYPIILYKIGQREPINSNYVPNIFSIDKTNTDEFYDGYIADNYYCLGVSYDNYKLLFGQKLNFEKFNKDLLKAILIFLLVFISSTFFFFKSITNTGEVFFSIRYKLILIFVLAVYMPTLGLWCLAYTNRFTNRLAIENHIKKGMLDNLIKIDLGYKKNEDKVKKHFLEFDNYLKSFKGKKAPSQLDIQNELQKIVGDNKRIARQFNAVEVRDIYQNLIYSNYPRKDYRNEQISKVFLLIGIEKHCPERLNKIGYKLSGKEIMLSSAFENPIIGFSTLFERPQSLIPFNFEGVGVYWWWNYIKDTDNPIAYYMCNATTRHITSYYLESLVNKRFTLDNTNLKLAYFVYESQEFIPHSFKGNKNISDLINASTINKTVEYSTIKYENNDYLCLCFPGSYLKNCYILCFYPISSIDYKIEKTNSDIYQLIIVLLIVGILSGSVFARYFYIPIQEINKGLKSLSKRNTDIKLSIENKDELGLLGNAFNIMVSDINSMIMASAVQKSLIPVGNYNTENYDYVIYNKMAEDVGGDYADVFELHENRLLMVIGDVTGHGISSALLVAMVKASVFRFVAKNTPIEEIVSKTSDIISELLNNNNLMTFCAVVLDKNTGEIKVCNAGHPFPIIREKEQGKYRMICKNKTLPMGSFKSGCNYSSESDFLNPGETLILYTDGFPKAENDKCKEYGYDEFYDFIANSLFDDSKDLKDKLLNEFSKFHGKDELTDDVTFIILRRKPLQNN